MTAGGVQFHDDLPLAAIMRRGGETLSLPNRVTCDPIVSPEHTTVTRHDLARRERIRSQPTHHIGVAAGWDETDILAVGLLRDRQTKPGRLSPYRSFVRHRAQRE